MRKLSEYLSRAMPNFRSESRDRPQMPAPRIEYGFEVVKGPDGFRIYALSEHHRDSVGTLVIDTLQMTRTNYIRDIQVPEALRLGGIGKSLLRHALSVCPPWEFSLVSVTKESIGFWHRIALDPEFSDRLNLGLTPDEVGFLKAHQNSFK